MIGHWMTEWAFLSLRNEALLVVKEEDEEVGEQDVEDVVEDEGGQGGMPLPTVAE